MKYKLWLRGSRLAQLVPSSILILAFDFRHSELIDRFQNASCGPSLPIQVLDIVLQGLYSERLGGHYVGLCVVFSVFQYTLALDCTIDS
eukprot:COSAG02_NODE_223_length_28346_cov_91.381846_6_plen_89_part_00